MNCQPFAVAEGRVGEALEEVDRLLDGAEELVRLPPSRSCRWSLPRTGQVEAVDLLPHLRADLLAHLARVLARGRDAGDDRRRGCSGRRSDGASTRYGVDRPPRAAGAGRLASSRPQLAGARSGGRSRSSVRLTSTSDARGVLGALEVAAHPVEAVGDAGEHATSVHPALVRAPRCPCCRRPARN